MNSFSLTSLAPPLLAPAAARGSSSSSTSSSTAGICRCSLLGLRLGLCSVSCGSSGRRRMQVVRMAPEEERLTRRNPLDFPMEWINPKPGRRADIFPQFSPMKTPLPPPLPFDPPNIDEEEELEEEQQEDPEKQEGEEEEEEDPDEYE